MVGSLLISLLRLVTTEKDCELSFIPATAFGLIAYPSKAVHAYVLQVIVLTNHMNGKDTHIRGLRILGPEELVNASSTPPLLMSPTEKNQISMAPTILFHGQLRLSKCTDKFVKFD
jgi:hypothetical protein